MAAQETTVPMDDSALMESALAPEPVREERPAEAPQEQPRDDQGRFAPKTEATTDEVQPAKVEQPEPVQPKADEQEAAIPPWRARELREARDAEARRAEDAIRQSGSLQQQLQAMARQLEQLQKPKQDPVDFFQDPNAAFDQRLSPLQDQLQTFQRNMMLRASRAEAIAEHGRDAVKAAEDAIGKAMSAGHSDMPLLRAQMLASDHPVDVAVNWHKRSRVMEDTGGDLNAYRQRALDDALKDPAFLAKAVELARTQAGGQPTSRSVNIPPSLSRAAGTGATEAVGLTAADMTDASLYAHATARGGR